MRMVSPSILPAVAIFFFKLGTMFAKLKKKNVFTTHQKAAHNPQFGKLL